MSDYISLFNTSRSQKKLKKLLDNLGYLHVKVWWEPVSKGNEMCGMQGGYFFTAFPGEEIHPLGYNFVSASDFITNEMPYLSYLGYKGACK